jgi:hypothetical protein
MPPALATFDNTRIERNIDTFREPHEILRPNGVW